MISAALFAGSVPGLSAALSFYLGFHSNNGGLYGF